MLLFVSVLCVLATAEPTRESDLNSGVQMVVITITVAILAGLIGVVVFLLRSDDEDTKRQSVLGDDLQELTKHYMPPCENCGQKLPQNMLCEKCQVVGYCTAECQEAHLPRHREVCHRLAALRTKHADSNATGGAKEPANHASQRGYFNNWEATKHTAILKDTAAFFVKYKRGIIDCAVSHLPQSGRGLVLADVSTERFKPLHKVEDPVRLMYVSAQSIVANPMLSLLACNKIKDLVTGYDPNKSAVVVFTNGLNYLERMDAHCPALVLSFDDEEACRTILNMTSTFLVNRKSP